VPEGKECPTWEQVKAYSKGKIAHFKIPKYMISVDGFPMTVTGKIQKMKLRDIAKEKLRL
jgi:fatty-acyl-CoA synthase